ncbi:MAG: DUF885 domain-containing protein [Dehalococcoidia bacterium]|jgi:uncharacterized protein (DUF885 family)|nr:DUF885 domain-containing protein [Chloroflexota bacterium]MDP6055685.1 DUF885 domain-containing protein [Dehalococcoidia bacterium]MDP7262806.1 DUF885 domain-containing protein [Dehalococcoidia bacterium]MDP7484832.1 DUF885 domain-containing protein [Dehalococcoidia bacterium]|tara:strand:+ start:317 stop:2017 length:1701 start_codon:yes stop_codon:yes gene_type:complete
MASVFEIADGFIDTMAKHHPLSATHMGVPGFDHLMADYSPEATEAFHSDVLSALREMQTTDPTSDRERMCKDTFIDEISLSIEQYESREHLRDMNVLFSPVQSVRSIFDLMPRGSVGAWENIASRMEKIGESLAGYRRTLDIGRSEGLVTSERQVNGTAEQCEVWAGGGDNSPFFDSLVNALAASDINDDSLIARVEEAAASATEAYDHMGDYLRNTYLPDATPVDGVGRDRYALSAKGYLGADIDPEETYDWGWEQLAWVRSEMTKTAERIKPGASIGEAVELLETDPEKMIKGEDEFRQWMQDLQDKTIEEMDGVHFDILDPVRTIEALIAPPGGALAMYYTGPSEDFSRPGRTWYPTGGKTEFPIWREVSIAYHEGVPGHHFQIATNVAMTDDLSRFQRLLAGTSGHAEGWALYAERLMGELGYLENPDYYMGMLDAQALRSVRVIVDIGMHLGLEIPKYSDFHPGEIWTGDLALEFMQERVHFPADFIASEVDRYLGIPGQAISYKVGERVWLEARESAKQAAGADFDLKEWHNRALKMGPMGLAQMKQELTQGARFSSSLP